MPVDNKSVINDIHHPITDLTPTFQMLTPDFDIIQAIRTLISTLPIKVDIFHVKAHQDHEKPFNELTPFAQMNVLADCHAEHLHSQPATNIRIFPTWIPGTKAALFYGPSPITSDLLTYIGRAAHEPQMRMYLIEWSQTATNRKLQWNDNVFDSIAWSHMGEAIRNYQLANTFNYRNM